MKYLALIGVLTFSTMIFFGKAVVRKKAPGMEMQKTLDLIPFRMKGAYSLHDTSKGNCGIEAFKRFVLVNPIIFLRNGYFIQSPHSGWQSYDIVDKFKTKNQRYDYGKYYLSGNQVVLEGTFTFFARGMDWRHYQARYIGYLDSSRDTLFLKIGEPLPKINLRFNKGLARHLKEGGYQKYVFKSFPKEDVDIDETYLENMIRDKTLAGSSL